MKLKVLLILMLAAVTFTSYAQDGGIRGKVVSRNGRVALSNVQVKIESLGLTAMTDKDGNFIFENLPAGSYPVLFSTPDFEDLNLMVRVGNEHVQDLKSVIIVPSGQSAVLDDAVFAEFDSDSSSSDTQALPSSLSSSKDLFNNIASYRFSEMRFNVRGYDSQYSDIYLNGIRFNDAMTGYGPWSLWSGLNDATRNQENYTGLEASDFGIGGIGGMTNVNARASQMRKGFRVSVSNGNQMYRFRAMVSYGSGQLDNGWSYAFSVGTRQGGNGYVDGVYYNSYSYFASAEKLFGQNHRLALTLLASPSERGAQQASTDEAYALFGNNYYNPNVGYQAGKLRNSRVRNTHEPIVMLNYTWDMSENTRLNAATSLRFGRNGYSALTWNAGADPRGDYYRYMPNSDKTQIVPGITTDETIYFYAMDGAIAKGVWDGMLDYDKFFQTNMRNIDTDPVLSKLMGNNSRSNYTSLGEADLGRLVRFNKIKIRYAGVKNQDGVTPPNLKNGGNANPYPSWIVTDWGTPIFGAWYRWAYNNSEQNIRLYGSVLMSYNDAAEYTSDPGVYGIRTSGYSQFAMKPIPKDGTEGTVLGIYGIYAKKSDFTGGSEDWAQYQISVSRIEDLGFPPESLLSEEWIRANTPASSLTPPVKNGGDDYEGD